uniref:Uncharacterized protein n=1 Tax=Pseudomonas phage Cygsa01 TaxID=3138529 RepID=A0AAU6W3U2_9VIRU
MNLPDVKFTDLVASWLGLTTPRMAARRCFERFQREFFVYVVTLDTQPVDCLLVSKETSLAAIHDRRYGGDVRVGFKLMTSLEPNKAFRFEHEDTEQPDHVGRNVKFFDFSLGEVLTDLMAADRDLVAPFYYSVTSWARQETELSVEFKGIVTVD